MALTFQHAALAALLADAQASWPQGVRDLHGDHTEPGFWLVGDEGVYLMHNGQGWKPGNEIYADECNPNTMDFDSWWDGKRANFGGDDEVHFIPAGIIVTAVEAGAPVKIKMQADAFDIEVPIPQEARH